MESYLLKLDKNLPNNSNVGDHTVEKENENSTLPAILDGKYFIVINNDDGKIKAECVMCKSNGKKSIISGSLRATTNFKVHMKRLHKPAVVKFDEYKVEMKVKGARKKRSNESAENGVKLKQLKLSDTNVDNSLTRGSCVLDARRFKGTHSYDRIAEILFDIFSDYGLKHEQLVSTITDNASNFVKAFTEFGVPIKMFEEIDDNSDLDDDVTETEDENLQFIKVSDDDINNNLENAIMLPNHLRCSSHTLNLLATTDFRNLIIGTAASRLHHQAFAKCTTLWNLSRKPKSSEIINNVLGCCLTYPCPTRWNSLYDSTNQLLKYKAVLNSLNSQLRLSTFKDVEFEYLTEFCVIMKPIASALDTLQKEIDCYYGQLLPTLFSLRHRLKDLQAKNLCHAFKLRWLPEDLEPERKRIQNLCINAMEAVVSAEESREQSSSTSECDTEEEFFVFTSPNLEKKQSNTELQLVTFLNDKNEYSTDSTSSIDDKSLPTPPSKRVNMGVSKYFKFDMEKVTDKQYEGIINKLLDVNDNERTLNPAFLKDLVQYDTETGRWPQCPILNNEESINSQTVPVESSPHECPSSKETQTASTDAEAVELLPKESPILLEILKLVNLTKTMVSNIVANMNSLTPALRSREMREEEEEEIFKFPMNTLDDLNTFNSLISENPDKQKQLERMFTSLGGKTPKKFITRCLSELFGVNLACKCSWTGAKGNYPIQTALKYNYPLIKLSDFEECVKEWFRYGKQRKQRANAKHCVGPEID
ncbi:transposase-related [Holotrichia oblita]|uniref:Transposase-related n=1 Tax=Holotrichia oblita TaxID=644536 RepID=A0ACB9T3N7_HOLOL|nr:transposase-related [Holotrichia oblita]